MPRKNLLSPRLLAACATGVLLATGSLARPSDLDAADAAPRASAQERAARASLERARLEQGLIRAERTAQMLRVLDETSPTLQLAYQR